MKKILVIAITAALLAVMAVPAFAAETSTITGGWWSAWTPGYAVEDTLELDIDVKGGDNNWNNLVAVFANVQTTGGDIAPNTEVEGYKEYVVFRADSWGWGGGDNLSVDGNANVYTSDIVDANEDGDTWDDFRGIMADAHIDAVVEKTADGVKLTYNVTGANGASFVYTAETVVATEDVFVFFTCDSSEVSVTPVEAAPEETPDAPQTGFATVALAIVAIGSGAYIVSKKH